MANIEGTMVIRAWAEPAHDNRIRARLISSRAGQDGELVEAVGGSAEILLAVQRWLDSLQPYDNTAGP